MAGTYSIDLGIDFPEFPWWRLNNMGVTTPKCFIITFISSVVLSKDALLSTHQDCRFPVGFGSYLEYRLQTLCVCVCIHILKPGFFLVVVSSPVLAQQAQIHSVWCLLLFLHLGGASETSPCRFIGTFSILTIFLSTLYLWFLCFSLKYRISHFVI